MYVPTSTYRTFIVRRQHRSHHHAETVKKYSPTAPCRHTTKCDTETDHNELVRVLYSHLCTLLQGTFKEIMLVLPRTQESQPLCENPCILHNTVMSTTTTKLLNNFVINAYCNDRFMLFVVYRFDYFYPVCGSVRITWPINSKRMLIQTSIASIIIIINETIGEKTQ